MPVNWSTSCDVGITDCTNVFSQSHHDFGYQSFLADVFSQISDQSGVMEWDRFAEYLQTVLALTTAVFEAPTFGYTEATLNQCFKKVGNYYRQT